jgi:hypothetical protein
VDIPGRGIYRVPTGCAIRAHYQYFEVPLILEKYLVRSRQGFHLFAGVYAGWLLGARMSGLEGDKWRFFGDDYARIKSFDYGWILGFGTRARKKRSWRTDIDFRLEHGMAQLAQDRFFQNHGSGDSKYIALLVSLAS